MNQPAEKEATNDAFFKRLIKEPLLHFILLAAGVFVFASLFRDADPNEAPDKIVVSEARIKSLILGFTRTWQRPPTTEEVAGLIQDHIKEEVLYREALAMGLDRDDTLIRRRLRQKLEFVAEDMADAVEPTDEELQQYLDSHANEYRVDQRATFRQVYLSRERRGDSIQADAERLLAKLRSADENLDAEQLGDPTLLPHFHENLGERELPNVFGPGFAEQLLLCEPRQWAGPLESTYGFHLVRIEEKAPGRLPDLDEVRAAVRRDWYASQRNETKQKFFQELLKKYEVVIEEPLLENETGNAPAEESSE